MIKYCKACVMPATKPDLHINEEGVCNACHNFKNRKSIDWDKRRQELVAILDKYKTKDNSSWDCIIPVSGGKDSTYQTIRMLQFGMKPLCVTITTCDLSDIGRKNIENLKNQGVDYIEFTTNPKIRRKLNRIALTQIGDISWPEHVSVFTLPFRIALRFNIPLIVWGENSQNEYGGPTAESAHNVLDRRWMEEFAGMLGLRVADMISNEDIDPKDMAAFAYPSNEDLKRADVTGIFLGHYLPWDGYSNALLSQAHGFTTYHTTVEGSVVNYENLDNYQTGIHDYFKFLKFGFARGTDIASLHVRRGRITRQDALTITQNLDGKFPWSYLGKSLEDILRPLDLTVDEFIKICDRFTNKELFLVDARGNLIKDKYGNLTKVNYDNA